MDESLSNNREAVLESEVKEESKKRTSLIYSKWFKYTLVLLTIFLGLSAGIIYIQSINRNSPATKESEVTSIPTVIPFPTSLPSPTPMTILSYDPKSTEMKTFIASSGAQFRHPANWQVEEKIYSPDSAEFGPRDEIIIISPKGLIINYKDGVNGLGGGCPPESCPIVRNIFTENLTIPTHGTVTFVKRVDKDYQDKTVTSVHMGLVDSDRLKHSQYYMVFKNNDPKKFLNMFSVSIDVQKKGQLQNLNDYFDDPEVKIAETIIKSLSYTK